MSYQQLLDQFWQQYSSEIKAARDIHQLFVDEGEEVMNDHIALRTFNDMRVGINVIAQPFIKAGYVEKGQYDFPNKHLFAKHFEHPDANAPKVFISELLVEKFSSWLQEFVEKILNQIPADILANPEELMLSKAPWAPLFYDNYTRLLEESEYAAWMYAYGYRANHFTINVNQLKKYPSIQAVNEFIKKHGYALNAEGGEIKGTPAELLEQSSIRAEKQLVKFNEGEFLIPSCYYEFAKRYPQKDGKLYSGFIAASADKIFESTNVK